MASAHTVVQMDKWNTIVFLKKKKKERNQMSNT